MRERTILFNAPMVRAILAGTKTQTRRIISGHPGGDWVHDGFGRITSKHPRQGRFGLFVRRGLDTDFPECDIVPCPYGQPGDRLWVRETFQRFTDDGAILYKADPADLEAMNDLKRDECLEARWRPAIHMPRWASRITLEITAVRVERLQDISEADAIAEGVVWEQGQTATHVYESLWTDINGPGSWDANPWVWVVEFKRLEGGAA